MEMMKLRQGNMHQCNCAIKPVAGAKRPPLLHNHDDKPIYPLIKPLYSSHLILLIDFLTRFQE